VVRRDTRTLGNTVEQLVCKYLEERGLELIERNYRCRHGEIDLVMLDQDCLVFVEVRFRSTGAFSSAAASVDRRKQDKLIRTAEMYLATRPGYASRTARFDVVGVDGRASGNPSVDWIRDAFTA
jgi:putative endonuclease